MASEEEIERRVRSAESDAAAARVLAQCADRDVEAIGKKLAVHKALIEAVRETQTEHGRILQEHSRRFDSLETEMREGFARQAVGQAEITALLTRIVDSK